jgi:dipeptidyl aminopeptidase/acylaminoacyl peptidase
VYASDDRTLCLAADRGVVTTYSATVLGPGLEPVRELPLTGSASRARLSADGTLAATTAFVNGHGYSSSSFVTETLVTRLDGESYGNLEDFTLVHEGEVVKPVDRNIWGVTFASDDDTFYVTVAWGGRTWLARGSLSTRRLATIRDDAECPSLSPDGETVVYKKRQDRPPGQWRLAAYTISTGAETLLAETRSVDDQVEWLDDRTVLYGLARSGSESAISDIWAVPADGTGRPRLLVEGGWSPAVVR